MVSFIEDSEPSKVFNRVLVISAFAVDVTAEVEAVLHADQIIFLTVRRRCVDEPRAGRRRHVIAVK